MQLVKDKTELKPGITSILLQSGTLDDLPQAATQLLEQINGKASVICFEGAMGAGKTTLIKAIGKVLAVQDLVNSPTFSLVNEYETATGLPVYHFDFYRITNPEEAINIGTTEYFYSGALCFVEWPSLIAGLLPDCYVMVNIIVNTEHTRTITLTLHQHTT